MSYAIRENRKYFDAINPEKIIEIVRERERKLRDVLPELLKMAGFQKEKPIVEILEGDEGIKTVLNDILREQKEWLAFGSAGKGPEVLSYFAEHWEKEREKCVPLRAIIDSSQTGKDRGKRLSKLKNTQIRYVPEEYASPSSTWIYGDRMAFIIWNKERPIAVRMKSKEITGNYREHFEVLWRAAKE